MIVISNFSDIRGRGEILAFLRHWRSILPKLEKLSNQEKQNSS